MVLILNPILIAFHLYHYAYITSQFSYFSLPCDHINLTEVFTFGLVLFSFVLKQQYLISQLKVTLEKLLKRSASLRSISLVLNFMLKTIRIIAKTSSKDRIGLGKRIHKQ